MAKTGRITYNAAGDAKTFDGRDAVEVYRLAALMSALRLEMKGLKLSSKRSALAVAKRTTGLTTNRRELHLVRLQEMLDEQKGKVEHVSEATRAELRRVHDNMVIAADAENQLAYRDLFAMKFCPSCSTSSKVWSSQTVCPLCGKEGLWQQ